MEDQGTNHASESEVDQESTEDEEIREPSPEESPRNAVSPPVVRLVQLREQLKKDGTLDAIAQGLKEVDLRGGSCNDPITKLKMFYAEHGSENPSDHTAMIRSLQDRLLKRQTQNRALAQHMEKLELRIAILAMDGLLM